MSDPKKNVRAKIEEAEQKLEILREIDLLDAEFRLIENEYLQRRREFESRLEESEDDSCEQLTG